MKQTNSDVIAQNGELTRTITLHEAAAIGDFSKISMLIMEHADLLSYNSAAKLPIDLAISFVLIQIRNKRQDYSYYYQDYLERKKSNSLISVIPKDIEDENPLHFLILQDYYTEIKKS